ncbi:hypothetical protein HDV00_007653 [Rhizophlyctis rosea]|nr:hypothetical protein HDV00_007653 [Rhizophlyctis rosea]
MRKGKGNLKHKLQTSVKRSGGPSSTSGANPSPENTKKTVNELLQASRPKRHLAAGELLRAQARGGDVLSTYFLHSAHEAQIEGAVLRTVQRGNVAGPAPPAAWGWRPPKRRDHESTKPPSLQSLCARVIGSRIQNYKSQSSKFALLPFYHKEAIMAAAASTNKLTDTLLPLFRDPDLRTCTLCAASISLEGLASMLPNGTEVLSMTEEDPGASPADYGGSDERLNMTVVGDWEDLLDDTVVPVNSGCPEIHTLDISFCRNLPGMRTASIISYTLPMLSSLDISGCFDFMEGPSALIILAKHLINLRKLVGGYLPWLTNAMIMGIRWDTSWRLLEVLNLADCPLVAKDSLRRDMAQVRRSIMLVL